MASDQEEENSTFASIFSYMKDAYGTPSSPAPRYIDNGPSISCFVYGDEESLDSEDGADVSLNLRSAEDEYFGEDTRCNIYIVIF